MNKLETQIEMLNRILRRMIDSDCSFSQIVHVVTGDYVATFPIAQLDGYFISNENMEKIIGLYFKEKTVEKELV